MDVRVGPERRLSAEELMLSNCSAGEDSWESKGSPARRPNQSILKEISPEHSLEGLMLKLKLWYFGHLMQRADSLEKTLMLGKIEGKKEGATEDEVVGWHHWLNGYEFEQTLGDGERQLLFHATHERIPLFEQIIIQLPTLIPGSQTPRISKYPASITCSCFLSVWSHMLSLFSGHCLLHLPYELINSAFKTLKIFYAEYLGVLYKAVFTFLSFELFVHDFLGNMCISAVFLMSMKYMAYWMNCINADWKNE